jgi:hypothetical protein
MARPGNERPVCYFRAPRAAQQWRIRQEHGAARCKRGAISPKTTAATCGPVWAWIGLSRPADPEKLIATEMFQGAPPHARFRATTAKLLAGGAKGGLQKVSFKPK